MSWWGRVRELVQRTHVQRCGAVFSPYEQRKELLAQAPMGRVSMLPRYARRRLDRWSLLRCGGWVGGPANSLAGLQCRACRALHDEPLCIASTTPLSL